MPHLVSSFLRSSGNIANIKKAATRSLNPSRNASCESSRNNSISGSPYTSDGEEHAVKMPDLAEAIKKHNRLSLHFGRSNSKDRVPTGPPAPVKLHLSVESPPVVFHGTREDSTGALFSGQIFLDVKEESISLDSFTGNLSIYTTHKRPYQGHCTDCQVQVTKLENWQFIGQTTTFRRGRHAFPFSTLLNGQLPASMDTPVVSISYEFKSEAILTPGQNLSISSPIQIDHTVVVKRSVPEPLYPHHSVRVFPPTNIKAGADYLSVIHPTGSNKLTLKLDGLMTHNEKVKTVDMGKLKKVTWRLEETIKTVAPACDKHVGLAGVADNGIKGVTRNEVRIIGEKQLHEGWKSDYTGHDGTVDMELDFCVNQNRGSNNELKYACDMKGEDGTEVSHSLLLELIVSKEYANEGKTHISNATGTGRILRMHFGVTMTEYPGMGVSWDNESPPIYEDVPPSPPAYPMMEPPIEYEELVLLDARRASVETDGDNEEATESTN